MPAPKIINRGDDKLRATSLPVAAGTQIKPGWFVNEVGGACVAHGAAARNVFAGIAATGHEPNVDNHDTITVYEQCMVEVDCLAAAYTRGDELRWQANSGDTLVVEAANANTTMCFVAEDAPAGSTRIKVLVDVWALQSLRGSLT